MNGPALTYVDNTILTALVGCSPESSGVRRWFLHSEQAWVSSEIALARSLEQPATRHLSLAELLQAIHSGVAIRPCPLALAATQLRQLARCQPALSRLDALELTCAHLWRCHLLLSNHLPLCAAAKATGLFAMPLSQFSAPAVGDWPGLAPIPP